MSKIKKIKSVLKNIPELSFLTFSGVYFSLFIVASIMQGFADESSQELKTQSQLEACLHEEIGELGIKNKNIAIRFGEESDYSYAEKINGINNYLIVIHPTQNKRSVVKHELYHIADGLCDTDSAFLGRLRYLLSEPKACIYASTGMKL